MDILIFGAGQLGLLYYNRILCQQSTAADNDLYILAFIDNDSTIQGNSIKSIPIISPEEIPNFEFDRIVVSVFNPKHIIEILEQLRRLGVPKEKIEILNEYDETFDHRVIWLKNFAHYIHESNIPGSVAECGVYRGDFAHYINKYFYDRKLYLFDTFEGFSKQDVDVELNFNNVCFNESAFAIDKDCFKSTSIECVIHQLPYPENCIIKQGYFPQTAIGIHGSFCFVNLDMDLYQPMFAALNFFWEKMTCGGVILLHDYFHPDLPGVARAIADFEESIQMHISKFPIGDFCSIALVKK